MGCCMCKPPYWPNDYDGEHLSLMLGDDIFVGVYVHIFILSVICCGSIMYVQFHKVSCSISRGGHVGWLQRGGQGGLLRSTY